MAEARNQPQIFSLSVSKEKDFKDVVRMAGDPGKDDKHKYVCRKIGVEMTVDNIIIKTLYVTDKGAFPSKWFDLMSADPIHAWHSLNQNIIPFMNDRWGKQGINFVSAETAMDFYNASSLKEEIIETIKESIEQKELNDQLLTIREPSKEYSVLENTVTRLVEVTRLLNSSLTKITRTRQSS